PLGAYAMRLDIHPGAYLIHGTNNPIAVGMAITHGCIRMYPEDIEALFPQVPVNTPVWLINEPVKLARVNGQVWLEVHPPVDAEGQSAAVDLEGFYALVNSALGDQPAAIHWDFVLQTLKEASGIPQMIGLEVAVEDVPASLLAPSPATGEQSPAEPPTSPEVAPSPESPPSPDASPVTDAPPAAPPSG
ncbi:MAG TPA: L,D-transpeptidase, partial [Steroidobacteraceae bacterium]|nr:L,D-transpeptidase [Steroidobacteraceae bacterium]